MEVEVQSLFGDKQLGVPVHLRDIPAEERKFILRALDGYKEKYAPDGDRFKSKARIFADGSKQLDLPVRLWLASSQCSPLLGSRRFVIGM